MWRLLTLVVALLFGGLAFAQQPPLMGSEASPLAPAPGLSANTDESVFRILVIGDALAGGLGAGLTRMAQADAKIEVINRFNESSGLARREVYDWVAALPKIVADKPVDAVVVLVGVNDRQSIRDGNFRHVFRAPDWVKAYEANVDQLIDATSALNAKLFWISLPPMANAAFDADMQYLTGLHRARVAKKGGNFIDVRSFFVAPDGSYVDKGPDETGVERKLRARDGITFFKQGNNRFGQVVLSALKPLLQGDPAAVAAVPLENAPVVPAPAAAKPVNIAPPTLGQAGLDGEDIVLRADEVAIATQSPKGVQKKVDAETTAAARPTAKKGTWSDLLLASGLAEKPPAGRFDDFSVPGIP